ncbi:hypothetical protein K491DRAFT_723361 [Lophiostoma macrostomum CBS 122681]|uniref:Uncharacterized protein n=1 Tax=Lophiostoma macrostomum CBS 122681 TaxID=1314788 RepID=A0A6A6SKP9_9PLEO|nr:hypothetical protein K491DRAFT_723361 [Lophiostoma macrostomum CBS 122681]
MAGSDSSGGEAKQLPKPETTLLTIKIRTRVPRRQLTLVSITVCLNVLLWSSILVMVSSLYLIASDPDDTTNTPTEVLTILSSLVSIAYIVVHTIFSLKQRIWRHQGRHPSIVKKTSYVAVRFSVTLCILWLLTSGWNLITVARQPVCLPEAPGRQGWEAGTTCMIGRAGVAMSLIALFAACSLFGLLATVRRPFEAHVFKHGYHHHRLPLNPTPTPGVSRRPSPSRSASSNSEKYRGGRISVSTHRSTPSNFSNTDVDTIDLNSHSPPTHPSTILAPSPIRTITTGIFTSHAAPPPLPAAFVPQRSTSVDLPSRPPSTFAGPSLPIFHPSASSHHLPTHHLAPPPRMSALVSPSGFVPLSIPAQYTASAWKAVHPPLPSPLGPNPSSLSSSSIAPASRSYTHLPLHHRASSGNLNLNGPGGYNFSYRSRYSRSSISLTRPYRLSSTPASLSGALSSRSASTGPEEGRRSRSPGSASASNSASNSASASASGGANANANAGVHGNMSTAEKEKLDSDSNAIAYAILNGTKMPRPGHEIVNKKSRGGTAAAQGQGQSHGKGKGKAPAQGHIRRASAPADTVSGAIEEGRRRTRMELGWKPEGWKAGVASAGPIARPLPQVQTQHPTHAPAAQHLAQIQVQTLPQAPKSAVKDKDKRRENQGHKTAATKPASANSNTILSPRPSPENETGEGERNLRAEIEMELDKRLVSSYSPSQSQTVRKTSSQSTSTIWASPTSKALKDPENGAGKRKTTLDQHKAGFEEVKNKPLPRIAAL